MKVIRGGTQNTTVCGEFFRYINFFKIIPDVYLNIYPFFNQINIAIAEQ